MYRIGDRPSGRATRWPSQIFSNNVRALPIGKDGRKLAGTSFSQPDRYGQGTPSPKTSPSKECCARPTPPDLKVRAIEFDLWASFRDEIEACNSRKRSTARYPNSWPTMF